MVEVGMGGGGYNGGGEIVGGSIRGNSRGTGSVELFRGMRCEGPDSVQIAGIDFWQARSALSRARE